MPVTPTGSLRYMAVPARSRLRSDAKAVDGLDVGLGKAGCGAVPHVLPVLVEEQDRAKQAGKLGFHNEHQVLQYSLQRSIAADHLQDTTLSVTQRLSPLALGDVADGAGDKRAIFRLQRTETDLHGKLRSIFPPSVQLQTHSHRPHPRLGEELLAVSAVPASKPFRHQNLHLLPQQLFPLIPKKLLHLCIDNHDPALP